jgi:hypothetical protein
MRYASFYFAYLSHLDMMVAFYEFIINNVLLWGVYVYLYWA